MSNETEVAFALRISDEELAVTKELFIARGFIDHHEAKGSVMASWQAAWRTWVGKAIEYGHGKPAANTGGDTSWLAATGFETIAEAQNHRDSISDSGQLGSAISG
jgi:hypothetical protein